MSTTVRVGRWAAAALAALAVLPAVASASDKPYAVQFSTAASGATTQFTAKVTNETTTQVLGSANLTPPAGFTLSGAGATTTNGTVAVVSNVVQLRNLNVLPGRTETVTVKGDGCGTGSWTTAAKQSNDFNGTGNDFNLDTARSRLTTTSYTGCQISWMGQPGNTQTGQPITQADYDPTGAPVAVRVANGGAGVPVTVRASGGTLGGTTTQTTDASGVATFPGIHIDTPGRYTLVASSGGASATSNPFGVDTTSSPTSSTNCQATSTADGTCSGTATYTGRSPSDGSLFTNTISAVANQTSSTQSSGTLFVRWMLDGSHKPDCTTQGYTDANAPYGVPWQFDGPQWHKTITLHYDPSALGATVTGDVCFAGTAPFVGKGVTTTQQFDGTTYYVNLLADCATVASLAAPPPCVSSRTAQANWATQGLTITIDVPVLYAGDPYGH
jgi:hypothetical protein